MMDKTWLNRAAVSAIMLCILYNRSGGNCKDKGMDLLMGTMVRDY